MKKFAVLFYLLIVMAMVGVGQVAAALIVHESNYIYDEESGLYWLRDMKTFTNKTYESQIDAIGEMDDLGMEWRMADWAEMDSLWENRSFDEVFGAIGLTELFLPTDVYGTENGYWRGRVDEVVGEHHGLETWQRSPYSGENRYTSNGIYDTASSDSLGAWVVAGTLSTSGVIPAVPEPATWVLMSAGLSGMVWFRKRRNSLNYR